jgi:hypothetical protein
MIGVGLDEPRDRAGEGRLVRARSRPGRLVSKTAEARPGYSPFRSAMGLQIVREGR